MGSNLPIVYVALPLQLIMPCQKEVFHQSDKTKSEILLQTCSLKFAKMYSATSITQDVTHLDIATVSFCGGHFKIVFLMFLSLILLFPLTRLISQQPATIGMKTPKSVLIDNVLGKLNMHP